MPPEMVWDKAVPEVSALAPGTRGDSRGHGHDGTEPDLLEREAEDIAAQALQGPEAHTTNLAADVPSSQGGAAASSLGLGAGAPLPGGARSFFERRLGADLGAVRVHDDAPGGAAARRLGAAAFTVGHHVAFAPGHFDVTPGPGQRLIAHELAHVLQQRTPGRAASVQRQAYGPQATGAPTTWSADVAKAVKGSAADRATLLASAITGATLVDKTAACAGDKEVDPTHLVAFDSAAPTVSYDDNLNAKKGRDASAGFTKSRGTKSYVVLGPKALREDDFFWSRLVLSHEFDHVRQTIVGSPLRGGDSEVDAWVASFVRDFHRTYLIREKGSTCYVDDYQTFSQLAGYYEQPLTKQAVKTDAVDRIKDYYKTTLKPHAVHDLVFRFWLHRTMQSGTSKQLATDVNTALGGLVDPKDPIEKTRRFPCTAVKAATYPSPPSVALP
ncbi:MAG: eCIS core domain-containing protein [Acidimicrobiales bacterium]